MLRRAGQGSARRNSDLQSSWKGFSEEASPDFRLHLIRLHDAVRVAKVARLLPMCLLPRLHCLTRPSVRSPNDRQLSICSCPIALHLRARSRSIYISQATIAIVSWLGWLAKLLIEFRQAPLPSAYPGRLPGRPLPCPPTNTACRIRPVRRLGRPALYE